MRFLFVDPFPKICNVCVNARETRLGTSVSPRYDPDEFFIDYDWTAAVSLARVFPSLRNSSADHIFPDDPVIAFIAIISTDDWDFHAVQMDWNWSCILKL